MAIVSVMCGAAAGAAEAEAAHRKNPAISKGNDGFAAHGILNFLIGLCRARRRDGPATARQLWPGTHEVGQEEHDIREHHQNGDDGDVDCHEGQRLEGYFFKGKLLAMPEAMNMFFAQGRRGESDAATAGEDDAEMDRIRRMLS